MQLTAEQIEAYRNDGLLFFPSLFSSAELAVLDGAVRDLAARDVPGKVLEKDGKTVRALHGCHLMNDAFRRLTLHPRLLEPARQLLGSDVYVHQFKINFKAAFGGDVWPWHQDFIFWAKEDGMQTPRVINLALFLDEVNEFNGPLCLIPGSHRSGLIEVPARGGAAGMGQGAWTANFSADLKFSLDKEIVAGLVQQGGITAPKGPAGSVLVFDSNLAHGSVPNISPYDRKLLLVTYNSVENLPIVPPEPRPEVLVGRDYQPLEALGDNALLAS
ncbi:MAG: phytanoyl-CoA dioxygenase [Thermoanaerobaculia bacterium]|nr:phytanoyl-CoA dioxygenase [Thermoanaerobaculia bacterium]